jgi:hypothetical protein
MLMVNLVDRVVLVVEVAHLLDKHQDQHLNQHNHNQQELQIMDLMAGQVLQDALTETVVVAEEGQEVPAQVVLEVPVVLEYKHHHHLEILPQQ